MRYVLLVISILFAMNANAQPQYEQIRDKDTKDLIFKGQISYYDLENEPEFKWFNKGANAYEPDTAVIKYLQQHLRGYEIITVIGTWCEDSHNMIPKLYKVLRQADFNMKMHTMYALDLAKKGQFKEEEKYGIESVPTIILYKNGEEAGRIVETVMETVELDLKEIVEYYEE